MNLIAAVDKNWAIGKNNELLVSIPNRYEDVPSDDNRKSSCDGTERHWRVFRTDCRSKTESTLS